MYLSLSQRTVAKYRYCKCFVQNPIVELFYMQSIVQPLHLASLNRVDSFLLYTFKAVCANCSFLLAWTLWLEPS